MVALRLLQMNSFLEFLQGFFEERVTAEVRIGIEYHQSFLSGKRNEFDIGEVLKSDIGAARLPCAEKSAWTT